MRPVWAALLATLLASVLCGQDITKPQPSAPTFTSGTEYVEVPVIVQRSNKHVTGLAKTDFILQQDSKDVTIATFEEVHAIGSDKGGATGKTFTNSASFTSAQTPPQVVLLAIDATNTPTLD